MARSSDHPIPVFLWGVATSAYQIEGAPENDRTDWERLGRLKEREVRCGAASGHRERWRQDLSLLPAIGANAYRYSIEWSRLEPRPGEFDTAALELESERAGFLRARGIEPVVTLLHYTHPAWFWRAGGWENRDSVGWFRRLAERVGAVLPDVRMWVTVNEPITFILGGYLAGLIPPGKKSFAAAAKALEHLLRAQTEAALALAERPSGARCGLAHNMLDFAPDRPDSALDRRLAYAGWETYPQGFDRVLRSAASAGLPILVTENGIATDDDRLHRSFLHEHTLILAHHLAAGTPIEGYFYWSLLDNFEWLEGFRPRFGLFEVDYATLARRRRPSADLFAAPGRKFTGSRRVRAGQQDSPVESARNKVVEIWLLRHAKAEEGGPDTPDEERALTSGARKKMSAAALTIARLEPKFDAVLTSPLRRARQTAEPVAQALGQLDDLIETDALSPGADPKEILREIGKRRMKRVLLVGHMPHLGRLLGYLLTGRSNAHMEMKKGALARIEFEGATPTPPGTLTLLLTAKALARRTLSAG